MSDYIYGYVLAVKQGLITIDEVPEEIREDVLAHIDDILE